MKIFNEKKLLTEATIKRFISALPIRDFFIDSRYSKLADASELRLESQLHIGGGPVDSILLLICRAKQGGTWSELFVMPLGCELHSQESEPSKLKPIEMRESLQYPFAIETTERELTGRGYSVWQYYDAVHMLPFLMPQLWVEAFEAPDSEYFKIYPAHPAFSVVGRIHWPFEDTCFTENIEETMSEEVLLDSKLRFRFYSFPRSIAEFVCTPDIAYLSYKSETEKSELVLAYASTKI